jgi:hypothetical protein
MVSLRDLVSFEQQSLFYLVTVFSRIAFATAFA